MTTRKFTTPVLFVVLVLALGVLAGMTPAPAAADVPPVTPTVPGEGITDIPCEDYADCVILNYKWDTSTKPCCLVTETGEETSWRCPRCYTMYFRQHHCGELGLCEYQDSLYMRVIHGRAGWCEWGCHDGTCLPEPKPEGSPAYVSVSIHGMVPIEGRCREVGLVGVGVRLTGGDLPKKQTEGQDGEAHWEFYPGWGNGTHTVEVWDGVRWVPFVPMGSNDSITFHGSELRTGQTRDLGSHIWWAQCTRE